MAPLLNILEKIGIIKSWFSVPCDPVKIMYHQSKLKIDRQSRLVAIFTSGEIYLIRIT